MCHIAYFLEENEHGNTVLRRSDNRPIGIQERDMILSAAKTAAESDHNQHLLLKLEEYLVNPKCIWVFPKRHKDNFGHYHVVYFARDIVHPGLIKIGKTIGSAASRLSHLKHSDQCEKPENVAFIETYFGNLSEIESGFHIKFSQYRRHGEWFDEAPVLEFLRQMGLDNNGDQS